MKRKLIITSLFNNKTKDFIVNEENLELYIIASLKLGRIILSIRFV